MNDKNLKLIPQDYDKNPIEIEDYNALFYFIVMAVSVHRIILIKDDIIKEMNINLLSSKLIFSPLLKKLLGRNISIPTKTKVGISRALNRAFLLSIIDFKASFINLPYILSTFSY